MTPVLRTAEPNVLRKNKAKWLSALQKTGRDLAHLTHNPPTTESELAKAKQKFNQIQGKYNHSDVKAALIAMFYGKCAYCESKLTDVSYGEIEHFYPKSTYPDKTFAWTNLLLACSICNNVNHKGVKFPLDEQGNPLLIDPTDGVTNITEHFIFSWDEVALTASVYGRDARGQMVVEVFDLNGSRGRVALREERSREVHKLITLLKFAQEGNLEALAILKEACQSDAPYRGFALVYIKPVIG